MVPAMQARENGIYNQSSGCGCHSQTGQQQASVSISGLPRLMMQTNCINLQSRLAAEFKAHLEDSR